MANYSKDELGFSTLLSCSDTTHAITTLISLIPVAIRNGMYNALCLTVLFLLGESVDREPARLQSLGYAKLDAAKHTA